jgi:anthranilate 1,2-dioxygenase small subunit
VRDLLAESSHLLDSDRLEDWVQLFTEDCEYQVIPRINVERNLPLATMRCTNRRMLADRIVSLRQANIYNIHSTRHLVSETRITETGPDRWEVSANFALYQTDQDGVSTLFLVGRYADIVVRADGFRFRKRWAICDTLAIPTLLAVPV